MTAPVLGAWGERLRERTAPLAPEDERYGYAHAHLCEAIGRMLEQVGQIYDPPDPLPPAAPLLDPALCPDWALPWLAQLVGATLPAGVSAAQARELILGVGGWRRGTPAAMRAAAGLYLTGTQTVYLRERDGGDAYALEVVTLDGETPDPALVQRALLAAKPAGLILRYRTVAGWDWQQLITEVATWAELLATYSTWQDVLEKHPSGS